MICCCDHNDRSSEKGSTGNSNFFQLLCPILKTNKWVLSLWLPHTRLWYMYNSWLSNLRVDKWSTFDVPKYREKKASVYMFDLTLYLWMLLTVFDIRAQIWRRSLGSFIFCTGPLIPSRSFFRVLFIRWSWLTSISSTASASWLGSINNFTSSLCHFQIYITHGPPSFKSAQAGWASCGKVLLSRVG